VVVPGDYGVTQLKFGFEPTPLTMEVSMSFRDRLKSISSHFFGLCEDATGLLHEGSQSLKEKTDTFLDKDFISPEVSEAWKAFLLRKKIESVQKKKEQIEKLMKEMS